MTVAPRKWAERLAHHARPSNTRAVGELVLTLFLFFGTWAVIWAVHSASWLLALAMTPLAGLLLVRIFAIQHDCAHQTLFSSSPVNDWVGRSLGVLTMTSHDWWRHSHTLHHASSGNLDRRGFGDVDTMTVAEFCSSPALTRFKYRLYRHPLVLFGLGPLFLFLLQHRLPVGFINRRGGHWLGVMSTNAAIAVVFAAMALLVGWKLFFVIHLPIVLVAASVGVWLFYVQHQFSPTFWERAPKWEREHAALHGSSFYDLPAPLMWFTGNIGIHHVHHLASKIPFHQLPAVLDEFTEFRQTGRLTMRESFHCIWLALWDEESARMISFRNFDAMPAS